MPQDNLDVVVVASPARSEGAVPFTVLACATAILITLGIMAEPSQPTWEQMAKWGYLPAERIWDGALWALISSAFVHVALWHLVFNVYWLWQFGRVVEREFGPFRFLGFVVGAAFVSSAFQLAASGDTGIGASGIVYGLLGFMWRNRKEVPRFAQILGPDTASLFFVWLVACFVATHAGFVSIGNTAHLTGLLFGVLVAESRRAASHYRLARGSLGLFCALSLLAAHVNPWSERWLEYFAMKLHRDGQYERAVLAYERSLAFGADSAWAFHNLALTYASMGDSIRTADALRRLRATAPADADSLQVRLRGATR
jgi:rhomboid protease GluP